MLPILQGCKDDPALLLEADTYLSILGLFSGSIHDSTGSARRTEVECAAFNILAQLCLGSTKGRKAVTSAAAFTECFDKALELVSSLTPTDGQTTAREDGDAEATSEIGEDSKTEQLGTGSPKLEPEQIPLVEAAFSFLSSTI